MLEAQELSSILTTEFSFNFCNNLTSITNGNTIMDGILQHSTCASFQIPTATLENDFTTPLAFSVHYTNISFTLCKYIRHSP